MSSSNNSNTNNNINGNTNLINQKNTNYISSNKRLSINRLLLKNLNESGLLDLQNINKTTTKSSNSTSTSSNNNLISKKKNDITNYHSNNKNNNSLDTQLNSLNNLPIIKPNYLNVDMLDGYDYTNDLDDIDFNNATNFRKDYETMGDNFNNEQIGNKIDNNNKELEYFEEDSLIRSKKLSNKINSNQIQATTRSASSTSFLSFTKFKRMKSKRRSMSSMISNGRRRKSMSSFMFGNSNENDEKNCGTSEIVADFDAKTLLSSHFTNQNLHDKESHSLKMSSLHELNYTNSTQNHFNSTADYYCDEMSNFNDFDYYDYDEHDDSTSIGMSFFRIFQHINAFLNQFNNHFLEYHTKKFPNMKCKKSLLHLHFNL